MGATIVGICDGAWVLGNAGLLDERKATGHWFPFKKLAQQFPQTEWQRDVRDAADGNVITTTGVTASIPVCIALVAAIAGRKPVLSQKQNEGMKSLFLIYIYAAIPKIWWMKEICPVTSSLSTF